jgi:hypothetical protein
VFSNIALPHSDFGLFPFQRQYESVVGKPLYLNMRKEVTLRTVFILAICSIMTSFPFLMQKEIRPWFAVPFFYCCCSCVLNTAIWGSNGRALMMAAKKMMEDFEHVSDQEGSLQCT